MIREPKNDVRPSRFDGFLDVVTRMTARLTLKTTDRAGIIHVKNDITKREYQVDLDKVDAVPGWRLEAILTGISTDLSADEAEAVRELVKAGK